MPGMGGDEFVIVMPDTGSETAMRVSEKIRQKIEAIIFLEDEGLNINLTASFGVASYPDDAHSKQELISIADNAMFSAKRFNRNTVYLASTDKVPREAT